MVSGNSEPTDDLRPNSLTPHCVLKIVSEQMNKVKISKNSHHAKNHREMKHSQIPEGPKARSGLSLKLRWEGGM